MSMTAASRSTAPRVSVGMPVYNGERFVADAIDSVLAQEFEDLELIVSDNASTDATGEIARDRAARDPRVRYVRHERNLGAARNFNVVVELARGELFRWASHDDVVAPGYVARCVEVLDDDPTVVLAFPRSAAIDDDGQVIYEYPSYAYAGEREAWRRARSALATTTPAHECFGVARRDVLRRTRLIGPYTSSDRTFFLELALQGRFHEIDEVLFLHRRHMERSMQVYRDSRQRNTWFDPDRDPGRTSPYWRLLGEMARGVAIAPVPVADRVRALPAVGAWGARQRRRLAGELAVASGLRRAVERTSSSTDTEPVSR